MESMRRLVVGSLVAGSLFLIRMVMMALAYLLQLVVGGAPMVQSERTRAAA